jgi:hypothetical protein
MAEQPNDASRKSKAEGERWNEPDERSGISNRAGGAPREVSRERASSGPLDTPRRYEQPIEDDDDPVMPADDATLNTKM